MSTSPIKVLRVLSIINDLAELSKKDFNPSHSDATHSCDSAFSILLDTAIRSMKNGETGPTSYEIYYNGQTLSAYMKEFGFSSAKAYKGSNVYDEWVELKIQNPDEIGVDKPVILLSRGQWCFSDGRTCGCIFEE